MSTAAMNAEVLVLNATSERLNITTMKKAMLMVHKGKAELEKAYDFDIRSGEREQAAPSIIKMLYYVAVRPKSGRVSMTKKNVLMRDNYICQYCNKKIKKQATVDHVIPKNPKNPNAEKGTSNWKNLVACCQRCNQRKKNRTPKEAGMPLKRQPYEPNVIEWDSIKNNTRPEEWIKYMTTYHKDL